MKRAPARAPLQRGALRLLLFAGLWLGLNGPDWSSWIIGAPAVLLVTWLSGRWGPSGEWRWRVSAAWRFGLHFLSESLRGGWDVARRALHPGLPLEPGIIEFAPCLPEGSARLFFCSVISLLPGTLVVGIASDTVSVHALDATATVERDLRVLEARVGALFGLELPRRVEGPT